MSFSCIIPINASLFLFLFVWSLHLRNRNYLYAVFALLVLLTHHHSSSCNCVTSIFMFIWWSQAIFYNIILCLPFLSWFLLFRISLLYQKLCFASQFISLAPSYFLALYFVVISSYLWAIIFPLTFKNLIEFLYN